MNLRVTKARIIKSMGAEVEGGIEVAWAAARPSRVAVDGALRGARSRVAPRGARSRRRAGSLRAPGLPATVLDLIDLLGRERSADVAEVVLDEELLVGGEVAEVKVEVHVETVADAAIVGDLGRLNVVTTVVDGRRSLDVVAEVGLLNEESLIGGAAVILILDFNLVRVEAKVLLLVRVVVGDLRTRR